MDLLKSELRSGEIVVEIQLFSTDFEMNTIPDTPVSNHSEIAI